MMSADEPHGIRLGVVRSVSYGLFGPPDEFIPQARALGAGLVRAYLYWSQVEPEPGRLTWDTLDALLDQVTPQDEVWLTLCSASPWATRAATDFLPPSPALDLDQYARFVGEVVRRCAGRVRFFQCDNEPSNTGLLWAGTAAEYVTHLAAMHRAVKQADPAALVVLGGCGYDVLSAGPGSDRYRFFEHVTGAGRDAFDVFDVHLYGNPGDDEGHLTTAGKLMAEHGYQRPIVVGEHGGPVPFQFPAAGPVLEGVFAEAFAAPPPAQSTAELAARQAAETPERRAMTLLYERMAELPPQLAMFLEGCPPDLEDRRHRINRRQLVAHTLAALAAGARRTAYWNLAPEVPAAVDPRQMMHLLFGKLPLLAYRDGGLSVRRPAADTFRLLADQLAGVREVRRVDGHPAGLCVYEVTRDGRPPLVVLWERRDPFGGEDEPPRPVDLPWPAPGATAVDALGRVPLPAVRAGRLHLEIDDTPVFVTAGPAPTAGIRST